MIEWKKGEEMKHYRVEKWRKENDRVEKWRRDKDETL